MGLYSQLTVTEVAFQHYDYWISRIQLHYWGRTLDIQVPSPFESRLPSCITLQNDFRQFADFVEILVCKAQAEEKKIVWRWWPFQEDDRWPTSQVVIRVDIGQVINRWKNQVSLPGCPLRATTSYTQWTVSRSLRTNYFGRGSDRFVSAELSRLTAATYSVKYSWPLRLTWTHQNVTRASAYEHRQSISALLNWYWSILNKKNCLKFMNLNSVIWRKINSSETIQGSTSHQWICFCNDLLLNRYSKRVFSRASTAALSTMLRTTTLSYGNMPFSGTCPAETPQPIKMKFCTIDNAGKVTRCTKNGWNRLAWGGPTDRWNITSKNFLTKPYLTFFFL
jgi:hypothetical protein